MHRTDLIDKLKVYRNRWPVESVTVNRFIRFVQAYDDCFHRTLSIGHVTGSAWVVDQTGEHVLLTHHRKLHRWLQLGGHCDGETNVVKAALREVQEESGLSNLYQVGNGIFDIDIHLIPQRGDEPAHFHYDVRFAFRAIGNQSFVVSDESHELRWVPVHSLDEYTNEESMLRMARKWEAIQ